MYQVLAALILVALMFEVTYYVVLVPGLSRDPIKPNRLDRYFGFLLYWVAYILSILRLPIGIVPYSIRLINFFFLKKYYKIQKNSYWLVALHHLGDFLNVGIFLALLFIITGPPQLKPLSILLYTAVAADLIRLLTEHGQQAFSVLWQHLPHEFFAQCIVQARQKNVLASKLAAPLHNYCHYFTLNSDQKATFIFEYLKYIVALDLDLSIKLQYINGFRILPQSSPIRTGHVRDVVSGEIFVNNNMLNDPWLLIGLAMRRSPWIFDPRFLERPFLYRTVSAPLTTKVILDHVRFCPPFAVYQFGHEVKDARYTAFYSLLHHLNIHVEELVQEDGTYRFEQFFCWLEERCGRDTTGNHRKRPLLNDIDVISSIKDRGMLDEGITEFAIASRYTYPIKYVEEVLMPTLHQFSPMLSDAKNTRIDQSKCHT